MPNEYVKVKKPLICFKCSQFNHIASNCKNNPKCSKCSDNHLTKDCKSDKITCPNCKDKHTAYNKNCPNYLENLNKINSK